MSKGVITEERFQKMTVPQWVFSFMSFKKHEMEELNRNAKMDFAVSRSLALNIEAIYYMLKEKSGVDPTEMAKLVNEQKQKLYYAMFPDEKKKDEVSIDEVPVKDADLNKIDINDPEKIKEYMDAIYEPAPKTIVIPISKIRRAHVSGERFSSKDVLDSQRKNMKFVHFEGDTANQVVKEAQYFEDEWGSFDSAPKEEAPKVTKKKIKKSVSLD